jgi:TolB protein
MATRRILVALIGALTVFILIAGIGVAVLAGLALWRPAALAPGAQSLLVLDGERQLTLLASDGVGRTLADDASPELFHYPATAPDGRRIAYIGREGAETLLFSLDLAAGGKRVELYRSRESPPLYATWSPDGRYVSFLANMRGGGLGAHIVPADGSRPAELVGVSPSSAYFAWRPDSGALLLHSGGGDGARGRVATFAPGQAEPLSERADPGFFQAPAWSVDGADFFYVAQPDPGGPLTAERIESRLTRVGANGGTPQVLASELQAAIIFSRAPASDALAYTTVGPEGFGALKVVAADGGAARTLSRPAEAVAAFFWAPDGAQIAYLTIERRQGQPPRFSWHLVATGGGAVRDLGSFVPSPAFAALVNFFDAYAFALDLWSPDGRELVFGSDEGVFALDVANGTRQRRADGVLGLWVRQ